MATFASQSLEGLHGHLHLVDCAWPGVEGWSWGFLHTTAALESPLWFPCTAPAPGLRPQHLSATNHYLVRLF